MPEQSDITSTDSSCFKFTYCTSDSRKYRKHCKHTSYVLMSHVGGSFMYKEELVDKMRGIKALLYMASTTTDQIEDQGYAFALLGDQVQECIEELEEQNRK